MYKLCLSFQHNTASSSLTILKASDDQVGGKVLREKNLVCNGLLHLITSKMLTLQHNWLDQSRISTSEHGNRNIWTWKSCQAH